MEGRDGAKEKEGLKDSSKEFGLLYVGSGELKREYCEQRWTWT